MFEKTKAALATFDEETARLKDLPTVTYIEEFCRNDQLRRLGDVVGSAFEEEAEGLPDWMKSGHGPCRWLRTIIDSY